MKVFGCYKQKYNERTSVGGMIIACGNNVEEAYNSFSYDKSFARYNIPVFGKTGDFIGNSSIDYPLEKWFEMTELTANCDKARVLYESSMKL